MSLKFNLASLAQIKNANDSFRLRNLYGGVYHSQKYNFRKQILFKLSLTRYQYY